MPYVHRSSARSGGMWPVSLFQNLNSRTVLYKVWSPGHLVQKTLGFVMNTDSKTSPEAFLKQNLILGVHQISPDGLFNKIPRWFWWTLKFQNCCRRDSTPCFCTLCHKDSERDREFVSNTMRDKPDESWWYELWISSCQRNPFRQERPALAFNGVERNWEPKEFLLQTAVSRGCSQVTSCSDAQTHTAANLVQMDSHPLLIAHGRSSGCSQGNSTSSLMGPL